MPSDWPAELPQSFQVDGFQEGVGDAILEFQPDKGPTMSRRRFTAVAKPLTCSTKLTFPQLNAFISFFETTLGEGTLPFNLPAQRGLGIWLVKFKKDALPVWGKAGPNIWEVSFGLWKLP